MTEQEVKKEVIEKLIAVCGAGRAGRRLELVPAFAEIEGELVRRRDELAREIEAQSKAA